MIDIKTKEMLAGDESWPFMSSVVVSNSSPTADSIPIDADQVQAEKIVQTWQKAAVLKVSPDIDVYFGFQAGDHMQFLNVPVQKQNGLFGARVGDGDVRFFIIPTNLTSRPSLKLVDTVDIDDKNYADLPLY